LSFDFRKKKKKGILRQVHVINKTIVKEPPYGEEEYVDLNYNVEACMLETNIYFLNVDDFQQVECTTKLVKLKLPSNSTLVVEFNLVELPTQ
jgi:hypothetical protein